MNTTNGLPTQNSLLLNKLSVLLNHEGKDYKISLYIKSINELNSSREFLLATSNSYQLIMRK